MKRKLANLILSVAVIGLSHVRVGLTADFLQSQDLLLNALGNSILPGDPGKVDLYFLGIAGDGAQGVFGREVNHVKQYFDNRLGTRGRSFVLANSEELLSATPLATHTSIEYMLGAIAAKMDVRDDILFIYLTSHGSGDFELALDQPGMDLEDLPAQRFGQMLAKIPVRWKVVMISACYSGGFIPYIENQSTLIITAASAGQPSFGCTDKREFTWFGEAFFRDALPLSDSFVEAFGRASAIVAEREKKEGFEPSNPQIRKPEPVIQQLKLWRAESGAVNRL